MVASLKGPLRVPLGVLLGFHNRSSDGFHRVVVLRHVKVCRIRIIGGRRSP